MKIVISPAKKMQTDGGFLPKSQPVFLDQAEELWSYLHSLDQVDLEKVWRANAKITEEARQMLAADLTQPQVPALFAYSGLQYQYLAADVLDQAGLDYLDQHLRVLSGLYGSLRPFDGIVPYRLEMKSPLPDFKYKSLYEFWGEKVYQELYQDDSVVLNLASKEYSRLLAPYLKEGDRLLEVVFQEEKNGKWRTQATHAKMARGRLVRWLAEGGRDLSDLPDFTDFGYAFAPDQSGEDRVVFRKKV